MTPPSGVEIYHDDLAIYWLENEALLCSVCKPASRTVEALQESFRLIRKITNGRKVCLLTDTSAAGFGSQKAREFSLNSSPDHFKAMAMISGAPYSSLLVNTFMTFSVQPIPMKIFNSEKDAREWIKNYA